MTMRALSSCVTRSLRAASGIASIALAIVAQAKAQDTQSIFLHGFASNGSTWASVGDSLSRQFHISVTRPTIGYVVLTSGIFTDRGGFASVTSMAGDLQTYLYPSNLYSVVAHSAGGLVARERIHETANANQALQINRLLTVATPHKGAPLAQTVMGSQVLRPLDQQFLIMNAMVPTYNLSTVDISSFYTVMWWPIMQQLAVSRTQQSSAISFYLPVFAPITIDLIPNSSQLLAINGAAGLQTEGATDRVSIVGLTTNNALFFKGLLPIVDHTPGVRGDAALFEQWRQRLVYAFFTAALAVSARDVLYYMNNGLPPCIKDAMMSLKYQACIDHVNLVVALLGAGYIMDNLNTWWARWIGSRGDNTTDAVLPDSTQFYPGLPIERRLTMSDAWHALETRESGAFVASVLSNFWSIPARIQPLSNWISKSGYYYTANPSGGRTPYTYVWEWCATNCSGGGGLAAPRAAGSVRPDRYSDGWQFFATTQTIYFVYSQRQLRSTVTDAVGMQAVAMYTTP